MVRWAELSGPALSALFADDPACVALVLGGTLALAGERVAELVVEHVRWAAHTGVRRALFVNGHVGNSAPLWLACDRLRFERSVARG
jgi:creatinine amidohydrolase/Fe(II)-dependent formamide hydrolase-like protein